MSPTRPDTAPAAKPIEVSAELKALMRRLKLGQLLDTLPERLALARTNRLPVSVSKPHPEPNDSNFWD